MFTLKRLIGGSLFVFVLAGTALAQEIRAPIDTPREPVAPIPAAPLVTAAATAKRVRFVSPGTVVQLRLEVYNETGQKLFDTELHGGNVLDWPLQDGAGQRLAAGSYACVLTIKSLSGRLSQRVGLVTVNDKKAAIEAAGGAQLSTAQQQTIGPVEGNTAFTVLQESEAEAITAVTHDGTEGQLARTRGALSFRLGDFLSGKDEEQMRLTAEGNLGIGTDSPQAKLDVAGVIRTSKGIEIANGTDGNVTKLTTTATGGLQQTLADGTVVANVSGAGTQDKIAKWTAIPGELGDSVITETGGRVGIGVTNPTYRLVVGPDIGPGLTTSDLTISRGPGQSVSIFAGATGAHGMNFGWDEANQRAFVNAPVQSPITFTHGGVNERMRIDTNGNVGIGTTTPATPLEVNGLVRSTRSGLAVQYIQLHGGDPGSIKLTAQSAVAAEKSLFIQNLSGEATPNVNNTIQFQVGTTASPSTKMIIDKDGNVGIGTTGPTSKLYVLSNTAGLSAVYGESASGRGVWGKSVGSRGVYGEADSGEGVHGQSNTGTGVFGLTAATNASFPGVYGASTGSGGVGVKGEATTGVFGNSTSNSGIGVTGQANTSDGIGVYGTTTSATGYGVFANNPSGIALGVAGNATQSRDKGGLVKAMLYVKGDGTILGCYNSQDPGGSSVLNGTTNTGCGFNVNHSGSGSYDITFNFQVNGRFLSVTPHFATGVNIAAGFAFIGQTEVDVQTHITDVDYVASFADNNFMLIVY